MSAPAGHYQPPPRLPEGKDSILNKAFVGPKQPIIDGLPTFSSPYEEREWVKGHMAAAFRYWGKLGFGDGLAGHITVRDPVKPNHFWMNPASEHFSMITKSMLVLVDEHGNISPEGAQLPINGAGFNIHTAIHAARPDVNAAAHCHSVYGKTWSAFGRPIDMLVQDSCSFYNNLTVYNNFGGVVLAKEEGENIAKAIGPTAKNCILQNHGLLTLGQTVDEAVYMFAALDRLCYAQLLVEAAQASGIQRTIIGKEEAEFTSKVAGWHFGHLSFQPEYKLILKETKGEFLQ